MVKGGNLDSIVESSTLTTGIRRSIGGRNLPAAEDYGGEVHEFVEHLGEQRAELPFVNQYASFMQVIRALSTQYPYVLLVGSPGIGKSMILDYVIKVLSGERPLDEVRQAAPEAVPIFERIMSRLGNFQNRDYVLLPNMRNPLLIDAVPYTDDMIADRDADVINDFCGEVTEAFQRYATDPNNLIGRKFSRDQFVKYIEHQTDRIFEYFYDRITTIEKEKKGNQKVASIIGLAVDHASGKLGGKWELVSRDPALLAPDCEALPYMRAIALIEEKEGPQQDHSPRAKMDAVTAALSSTGIEYYLEDAYRMLLSQVNAAEVDALTAEERRELFYSTFDARAARYHDDIAERYRSGELRHDVAILSHVQKGMSWGNVRVAVASSTVDSIAAEIADMKKEYAAKECSPGTREWISGVCDYFGTNKRMIENGLKRILMLYEERDFEKSLDINSGRKKKPAKGKPEDFTDEFSIPHGRVTAYSIDEIMDMNYLGCEGAANACSGAGWIKISDLDVERMFLVFNGEEEDCPPHMQVEGLGPFFQGGILYFPDRFGDFTQYLSADTAHDGNGERAQRLSLEQFLDFLQTGKISITYHGTTYRFDAPKMILAADNDDPFHTTSSGREQSLESLRGRFHPIYVTDIAPNTPETRRGNLRVIYNAVEQYNLDREKAGATVQRFTLSEDAACLFLQFTLLSDGLVSLQYRELSKVVEDICAFAEASETYDVTGDVIRSWIKDTMPPTFFKSVDSQREYGGYFDQPEMQTGRVNGLALSYDNSGALMGLRSYFISGHLSQGERPRFSLVDIDNQMTDETMMKGYDLATDYISRLLDHFGVSKVIGYRAHNGWQVKTEFGDHWDGVAGPSASMAIAISILSALADEPIYNNRFMTGTLDPAGVTGSITTEGAGQVGMIGGTYYKALIPARLRDIAEQETGKVPTNYFLFPAGNLRDLSANLMFDTYGLEEKVTCIPIASFPQAYYLATCGPVITEDQWEHSQEYGMQKLEKTMQRVQDKFMKNLTVFQRAAYHLKQLA